MATDRPSPRRPIVYGKPTPNAGCRFQWPRIGRHLGARARGKVRLRDRRVSMATDRPSPRRRVPDGTSNTLLLIVSMATDRPSPRRRDRARDYMIWRESFNGHGSAVTSAPTASWKREGTRASVSMATDRPSPRRPVMKGIVTMGERKFQWPRIGRHLGAARPGMGHS